MLSQEDFLVSRSAKPGTEKAQMITVTSGQKCSGLLTKSDRLTFLAKTLLESSAWYSNMRILKWDTKIHYSKKRRRLSRKKQSSSSKPSETILSESDIPSNFLLFQLRLLEHGTKETGSGFWLTPTVVQGQTSPERIKKRTEYRKSVGRQYVEGSLQEQVMNVEQKMFLTPTTSEHEADLEVFQKRMEKYPNGTTMPNLATQVKNMFPTPRTTDVEGGKAKNVEEKDGKFFRKNQKGERWGVKLRDVVENEQHMFPTPNTMDHRTDLRLNNEHSEEALKGGCSNLREKVHLIPTPRVGGQEGYETRAKRKGHDIALSYLESWVEFFPTPTRRDYKGANGPAHFEKKSGPRHINQLPNYLKYQKGDTTGQLNPYWTEWLMGFPVGWTELRD